MKKIIFVIFFLYFLILLQTGFLNFLKVTPNFVLLTVLILVIFEKQKNLGLISAFLGGFFLDIFSGLPLGVATTTLIAVYFISTALLRFFLKVNLLEVSLIIILGTIFYNFLIPFLNYLSGFAFGTVQSFQFNFSYLILIEIISNLIIGIIIFYLIRYYGFFKPAIIKRVK